MRDTQNQNQSCSVDALAQTGSVDPLAKRIVDELKKSDPRWRLGFPPPEEMEKLRAENAERHLQDLKRRIEAKGRKLAKLESQAREVIQRNRDEQW